MISSFMGLETAKRGLTAAQSALYTTGQNVSNANTEGYTRQRVSLTQTTAYPSAGMNTPKVPGQIGTGVETEAVQRIREGYLDVQYRTQSQKLGYYGALTDSLSRMEQLMDETGSNGLQGGFSTFWRALQGLSTNADNSATRAVAASSGQALAETFNYYANSLESIQKDIGNQIETKASEINSILNSINELNKQIASIEPNGYLPNDLYDKRDLLVDNLSELVEIKVTAVRPDNYGQAKDIAEGLYQIDLIDSTGTPHNLVKAEQATGNLSYVPIAIQTVNDVKSLVVGGTVGADGTVTGGTSIKTSGELGGLMESHNATYPAMLTKLNQLAFVYVSEFNAVHQEGFDLNGDAGQAFFVSKNGETLSEKNAAKLMTVSSDIMASPSKIAAAGKKDAGTTKGVADNTNAKTLAGLASLDFSKYNSAAPTDFPKTGTVDSYYAGIIGDLGVQSKAAQKNYANAVVLADSIHTNRQSVSAVSLDEEMTDMIKYQQAYNAAARIVTMVDEMLDKIVNGLGTGGR